MNKPRIKIDTEQNEEEKVLDAIAEKIAGLDDEAHATLLKVCGSMLPAFVEDSATNVIVIVANGPLVSVSALNTTVEDAAGILSAANAAFTEMQEVPAKNMLN